MQQSLGSEMVLLLSRKIRLKILVGILLFRNSEQALQPVGRKCLATIEDIIAYKNSIWTQAVGNL